MDAADRPRDPFLPIDLGEPPIDAQAESGSDGTDPIDAPEPLEDRDP